MPSRRQRVAATAAVWAGAGLVCAAVPARGAEVVGVAAFGREVYVALAPGEAPVVGQVVVGSGKQAQVAEVVGRRARLTLVAPAAMRKGDKIALVAQATRPTADPAPAVPQRSWRSPPPAPARDDAAVQARWQAWHASWSPYLDPPRVHGRDPASRIDGTFTALAAVVRSGAQPWALVRLGSQLAWSGVGGTPLGWQHDVSLWIDQMGWSPRAAERRFAQVRQAQVVWQPADGVGPRWSLGRLWAPLGCQQAPIDGLSVAHPFGPSAELSVFAGLVPSAGSTAPQVELWRAGASAHGKAVAGDWQAQGQVAASAGGGERATVGVSLRADHPRWGSADGAVDLGLGAPNLSRTAWSSLAAPTGVRPTYATAQWHAPAWGGWQTRARYTHARVEPTRDAALGVPAIGAHSATFDDVALSVYAPQWRRWSASASLWGTWWRSADPWLDRRLGGTVAVRMPNWPAANGNVELALVGHYGALLTGASAALSAELSPSDRWRWHGRLRWSLDRVESVAVVGQAVDARVGADFGRHPWIVSVSTGVRQTVSGAAADWIDALLAVAYRL